MNKIDTKAAVSMVEITEKINEIVEWINLRIIGQKALEDTIPTAKAIPTEGEVGS